MVHAVAEQIGGRVPLLGGVGRSIDDACALARASRAAGASALMVHQPPDPFVSPRGVVDYVKRVAEAGGGLPLMLYLRNDGIGLDAIETLCRRRRAWPASSGRRPTPLRLAEAIRRSDPDIVWVGGLAETWAPPLCAVGARGFTSGLINVWPEHSVAIHAALEAGDYPRGEPAHRRDARLRGDPRRGAERHQRHRRQGRPAAHRRGLRPDPAAVGVAADRQADGKAARAAGRRGSSCPDGTTPSSASAGRRALATGAAASAM